MIEKRLHTLLSALVLATSGCMIGPSTLESTRLPYNEAVKVTGEEQLLLNIVRLRYGDTPSSIAISGIAAQTEIQGSLGLTPFYGVSGGDLNVVGRSRLLPQFGVTAADRPTISLTPIDDQDFTRRLFTPLSLDGMLYIAKTTWPISTVFRLYLENLNWVPNAETASGPTPGIAPVFEEFRRGIQLMQNLQDRGWLVFASKERVKTVGGPFPFEMVRPEDVLNATKDGLEYLRERNKLRLVKKEQHPVLYVHPDGMACTEMAEFARIFHLKPGLAEYDITAEALNPFPENYPAEGVETIDIETRSLLQALYFVAHGIEVPKEHLDAGITRLTVNESGLPFDWSAVTGGLFRVRWSNDSSRPATAHVAVPYRSGWYYVDESDYETKSTFSLLLELSRLQFDPENTAGPVLTLPLGGK